MRGEAGTTCFEQRRPSPNGSPRQTLELQLDSPGGYQESFVTELLFPTRQVSRVPLPEGWSLLDLPSIWVDNDGQGQDGVAVFWGSRLPGWFAKQPDGSYTTPQGWLYDLAYDPAQNQYVLDDRHGTRFRFDPTGRLLQVRDRNNNLTTYAYTDADGDGQPLELAQVTDQLGRTATFAYNAQGYLASYTNPAGQSWQLVYSGDKLVQFIAPDPDGSGPLPAPVTSYSYNAQGLLERIDHPDGSWTTYTYDPFGVLVEENHSGSTTRYQPIRSLELLDPATNSPSNRHVPLLLPSSGTIADAVGSWTDPLGNTWNFSINQLGRTTRLVDPLGGETRYQYNSAGQLTAVDLPDPATGTPDGSPEWSYAYDAAGNLLSVTDPAGNADSYTYGPFNLLASWTDPLGNTTTYTRDPANGNLTTLTLPDGAQLSFQYSADPAAQGQLPGGLLLSETDPLGRTTSYSYDLLDRLTQQVLPDPDGSGPLAAPVTTYTYDPAGRLASVTDPAGNTTSYTYDTRGRLVELTLPDPDGPGPLAAPVTTFSYDAAGQLTALTDPAGNTTTFVYDAAGRLVSETDPLGATTSYSYDLAGNLLSLTDPLGNTTTYSYDALDRLVEITLPDPDGPGPQAAPQYTTAYDILGQVTQQTDPLGRTTSYTYDNLGRLTSQTDPAGFTTSYSYDAASRLTSLTDPAGNTTSFAYDAAGRLLSETDPLGPPPPTATTWRGTWLRRPTGWGGKPSTSTTTWTAWCRSFGWTSRTRPSTRPLTPGTCWAGWSMPRTTTQPTGSLTTIWTG